MSTKMVIHTTDGHTKVLEFRTDYTDWKIEDGALSIFLDSLAVMIYAKGYWKTVEFNRQTRTP